MLQLHMFSRVPQILVFVFFNTNLSALLEAHVHDNDLESDGVFTVRDLFFLYWLLFIDSPLYPHSILKSFSSHTRC